ncbi:vacuolar protein sorting 13B isoform 4 [Capsaspora owczarzaki ATCC 30864]|uniref:Vacuolar protein sorting 13B isoform 4 n=1 Tax=Capsaspora owczarzaki (strain ATCC 30864) TaxID=595528 RepID=A0A0D2WLA3_CAPO3|nr:vacuolar protein sorting 13B isoform 4 [Capsaspora owczarzaki ATCC 30864]KJE91315.1 vacuolar protein sorting 13B isoform 4 [Capsaspora owczarzaki ATCC 30864]|eukprot:XP_004349218.1 vacuolar protein sorting 13B isoform 4 [Capsaspora owczarzaki ATCC 30864]
MLEGYITPILRSYIDKYVKNLQASDLKLSVWMGDFVLRNLELRLDVLEREAHMPVRFLSGRVAELRVHVPWTRLTSEPVVLTFNTVELVITSATSVQHDAADAAAAATAAASTAAATDRPSATSSIAFNPDTAAWASNPSSEAGSALGMPSTGPDAGARDAAADSSETNPNPSASTTTASAATTTGYLGALIAKIQENISLCINNLIIKYVEGDIVLTLTSKGVQMRTCSANWLPAFVDRVAGELRLLSNASATTSQAPASANGATTDGSARFSATSMAQVAPSPTKFSSLASATSATPTSSGASPAVPGVPTGATLVLPASALELHRLLELTDVTFCLDHRNSSGSIDVFQEPLLYRSTIAARIKTDYDATNPSVSVATAINLFSQSMRWSLTEKQIPMLYWLYNRFWDVYYDFYRNTPLVPEWDGSAGDSDNATVAANHDNNNDDADPSSGPGHGSAAARKHAAHQAFERQQNHLEEERRRQASALALQQQQQDQQAGWLGWASSWFTAPLGTPSDPRVAQPFDKTFQIPRKTGSSALTFGIYVPSLTLALTAMITSPPPSTPLDTAAASTEVPASPGVDLAGSSFAGRPIAPPSKPVPLRTAHSRVLAVPIMLFTMSGCGLEITNKPGLLSVCMGAQYIVGSCSSSASPCPAPITSSGTAVAPDAGISASTGALSGIATPASTASTSALSSLQQFSLDGPLSQRPAIQLGPPSGRRRPSDAGQTGTSSLSAPGASSTSLPSLGGGDAQTDLDQPFFELGVAPSAVGAAPPHAFLEGSFFAPPEATVGSDPSLPARFSAFSVLYAGGQRGAVERLSHLLRNEDRNVTHTGVSQRTLKTKIRLAFGPLTILFTNQLTSKLSAFASVSKELALAQSSPVPVPVSPKHTLPLHELASVIKRAPKRHFHVSFSSLLVLLPASRHVTVPRELNRRVATTAFKLTSAFDKRGLGPVAVPANVAPCLALRFAKFEWHLSSLANISRLSRVVNQAYPSNDGAAFRRVHSAAALTLVQHFYSDTLFRFQDMDAHLVYLETQELLAETSAAGSNRVYSLRPPTEMARLVSPTTVNMHVHSSLLLPEWHEILSQSERHVTMSSLTMGMTMPQCVLLTRTLQSWSEGTPSTEPTIRAPQLPMAVILADALSLEPRPTAASFKRLLVQVTGVQFEKCVTRDVVATIATLDSVRVTLDHPQATSTSPAPAANPLLVQQAATLDPGFQTVVLVHAPASTIESRQSVLDASGAAPAEQQRQPLDASALAKPYLRVVLQRKAPPSASGSVVAMGTKLSTPVARPILVVEVRGTSACFDPQLHAWSAYEAARMIELERSNPALLTDSLHNTRMVPPAMVEYKPESTTAPVAEQQPPATDLKSFSQRTRTMITDTLAPSISHIDIHPVMLYMPVETIGRAQSASPNAPPVSAELVGSPCEHVARLLSRQALSPTVVFVSPRVNASTSTLDGKAVPNWVLDPALAIPVVKTADPMAFVSDSQASEQTRTFRVTADGVAVVALHDRASTLVLRPVQLVVECGYDVTAMPNKVSVAIDTSRDAASFGHLLPSLSPTALLSMRVSHVHLQLSALPAVLLATGLRRGQDIAMALRNPSSILPGAVHVPPATASTFVEPPSPRGANPPISSVAANRSNTATAIPSRSDGSVHHLTICASVEALELTVVPDHVAEVAPPASPRLAPHVQIVSTTLRIAGLSMAAIHDHSVLEASCVAACVESISASSSLSRGLSATSSPLRDIIHHVRIDKADEHVSKNAGAPGSSRLSSLAAECDLHCAHTAAIKLDQLVLARHNLSAGLDRVSNATHQHPSSARSAIDSSRAWGVFGWKHKRIALVGGSVGAVTLTLHGGVLKACTLSLTPSPRLRALGQMATDHAFTTLRAVRSASLIEDPLAPLMSPLSQWTRSSGINGNTDSPSPTTMAMPLASTSTPTFPLPGFAQLSKPLIHVYLHPLQVVLPTLDPGTQLELPVHSRLAFGFGSILLQSVHAVQPTDDTAQLHLNGLYAVCAGSQMLAPCDVVVASSTHAAEELVELRFPPTVDFLLTERLLAEFVLVVKSQTAAAESISMSQPPPLLPLPPPDRQLGSAAPIMGASTTPILSSPITRSSSVVDGLPSLPGPASLPSIPASKTLRLRASAPRIRVRLLFSATGGRTPPADDSREILGELIQLVSEARQIKGAVGWRDATARLDDVHLAILTPVSTTKAGLSTVRENVLSSSTAEDREDAPVLSVGASRVASTWSNLSHYALWSVQGHIHRHLLLSLTPMSVACILNAMLGIQRNMEEITESTGASFYGLPSYAAPSSAVVAGSLLVHVHLSAERLQVVLGGVAQGDELEQSLVMQIKRIDGSYAANTNHPQPPPSVKSSIPAVGGSGTLVASQVSVTLATPAAKPPRRGLAPLAEILRNLAPIVEPFDFGIAVDVVHLLHPECAASVVLSCGIPTPVTVRVGQVSGLLLYRFLTAVQARVVSAASTAPAVPETTTSQPDPSALSPNLTKLIRAACEAHEHESSLRFRRLTTPWPAFKAIDPTVDDIRREGFEYQTEILPAATLPQPGQVCFSRESDSVGLHPTMLTWNYGHRRSVSQVKVLPVAFFPASPNLDTSELCVVQHPDTNSSPFIVCELSWFDEIRQAFVPLQRLALSEQETAMSPLQGAPAARLWRLRLLVEGMTETDRVTILTQRDRQPIAADRSRAPALSSLALAGAVSISSCRVPLATPNLEAVLRLPELKILLVNHPASTFNMPQVPQPEGEQESISSSSHSHAEHRSDLPFAYMTLDALSLPVQRGSLPIEQEVVEFSLPTGFCARGQWFAGAARDPRGLKIDATVSTSVALEVLDPSDLCWTTVIPTTSVHVGLRQSASPFPAWPASPINATASVPHLAIALSPAIAFGLVSVIDLWSSGVTRVSSSQDTVLRDPNLTPAAALALALSSQVPVMHYRYVIVNETQVPLRFGQLNTDEDLILDSGHAMFYSWRQTTVSLAQQLQIQRSNASSDSPAALKPRRLLHVCTAGPLGADWRWSDPFSIDTAHPTELPLTLYIGGARCRAAVFLNVLAGGRVEVTIRGHASMINRASIPLDYVVWSERSVEAVVVGSTRRTDPLNAAAIVAVDSEKQAQLPLFPFAMPADVIQARPDSDELVKSECYGQGRVSPNSTLSFVIPESADMQMLRASVHGVDVTARTLTEALWSVPVELAGALTLHPRPIVRILPALAVPCVRVPRWLDTTSHSGTHGGATAEPLSTMVSCHITQRPLHDSAKPVPTVSLAATATESAASAGAPAAFAPLIRLITSDTLLVRNELPHAISLIVVPAPSAKSDQVVVPRVKRLAPGALTALSHFDPEAPRDSVLVAHADCPASQWMTQLHTATPIVDVLGDALQAVSEAASGATLDATAMAAVPSTLIDVAGGVVSSGCSLHAPVVRSHQTRTICVRPSLLVANGSSSLELALESTGTKTQTTLPTVVLFNRAEVVAPQLVLAAVSSLQARNLLTNEVFACKLERSLKESFENGQRPAPDFAPPGFVVAPSPISVRLTLDALPTLETAPQTATTAPGGAVVELVATVTLTTVALSDAFVVYNGTPFPLCAQTVAIAADAYHCDGPVWNGPRHVNQSSSFTVGPVQLLPSIGTVQLYYKETSSSAGVGLNPLVAAAGPSIRRFLQVTVDKADLLHPERCAWIALDEAYSGAELPVCLSVHAEGISLPLLVGIDTSQGSCVKSVNITCNYGPRYLLRNALPYDVEVCERGRERNLVRITSGRSVFFTPIAPPLELDDQSATHARRQSSGASSASFASVDSAPVSTAPATALLLRVSQLGSTSADSKWMSLGACSRMGVNRLEADGASDDHSIEIQTILNGSVRHVFFKLPQAEGLLSSANSAVSAGLSPPAFATQQSLSLSLDRISVVLFATFGKAQSSGDVPSAHSEPQADGASTPSATSAPANAGSRSASSSPVSVEVLRLTIRGVALTRYSTPDRNAHHHSFPLFFDARSLIVSGDQDHLTPIQRLCSPGQVSSLQLVVGDIQLDNQLIDRPYSFPVLLHRLRDRQWCSSPEQEHMPMLMVSISRVSSVSGYAGHRSSKRSSGVAQLVDGSALLHHVSNLALSGVSAFSVQLQPFAVSGEDIMLYCLGAVGGQFSIRANGGVSACPPMLPPMPARPTSMLPAILAAPFLSFEQQLTKAPATFTETIHIAPVCIVVTVHASIKVFISIDRMPLYLSPIVLRHVHAQTSRVFSSVVASKYKSNLLYSAPSLVGSLELLGNVTGLIRSIRAGVSDLVSLPLAGLRGHRAGPNRFLAGLGEGSLSFVRHVAAGSLSSIASFSSSVARNITRLHVDDAVSSAVTSAITTIPRKRFYTDDDRASFVPFAQGSDGESTSAASRSLAMLKAQLIRHDLDLEALQTQANQGSVVQAAATASLDDYGAFMSRVTGGAGLRPSGAADGLSKGLQAFGYAMIGGIAGIVEKPRQSFNSNSSVVLGLGRGLLGAIASPLTGAMALINYTSRGLLETVSTDKSVGPLQPPLAVLAAAGPNPGLIDDWIATLKDLPRRPSLDKYRMTLLHSPTAALKTHSALSMVVLEVVSTGGLREVLSVGGELSSSGYSPLLLLLSKDHFTVVDLLHDTVRHQQPLTNVVSAVFDTPSSTLVLETVVAARASASPTRRRLVFKIERTMATDHFVRKLIRHSSE